jgi:hypothetical protein
MTANNLHAHIATTSRDCDSTYHNDYVMTKHDEAEDSDFANEVLTHMISAVTFQGAKLEITNDDEYRLARIEWSEATEEGFRHKEAVFCTDDCDTGERRYRDETAEAAGY